MVIKNYSNTAALQPLTAGVNSSDITLTVGNTSSYPNAPFLLSIDRGTVNQEVCYCSAKTSTTFTVQRGYDGTTAVAHLTGASVELTVSAEDYSQANAHVNTAHVPPTLVDAKGDLFVGTSNDNVGRLPVGVDGYNIISDATNGTGLRWEKSRGTVVCTSVTRPTLGLYEGVRMYETDTKIFYVYSGSVWVPEPGQSLGITRQTTSSGTGAGVQTSCGLNFTMPSLAGGRRVELHAQCYHVAAAASLSLSSYLYGYISTSGGVNLAINLAFHPPGAYFGMHPLIASITNTEIVAGATTVYFKRMLQAGDAGSPYHQMVADTSSPIILRAMIV